VEVGVEDGVEALEGEAVEVGLEVEMEASEAE
jgi:hypothetical protein